MNRIKFNKYSGLLTTAILLLSIVCLVAIIILCVSGAKPDLWDKDPPDVTDSTDKAPLSRLERTPDYGQNYIDKIIFIGDTSISGLAQSGALDKSSSYLQVWSGAGGSLPLDYSIDKSQIIHPETGAGITVGEAAELKKPDYIVITVGIENGVAYCGEEKFRAYYSKLIDALTEASPSSKIILQSVFPVSEGYEKNHPSVTNEKIDRANLWIEELAAEKEIRYLDTSSVLKNEDGSLKSSFDSGNGLQLNSSGYFALIDYIRTHGYK